MAALLAAIWPDESPMPSAIRAALGNPHHLTLLRRDAGRAVALLGLFESRSAAGTRRWEFDLIGVHPDGRRRGSGARLLAEGLRRGAARGCGLARALIAADNQASQSLFNQHGFVARPPRLRLWLRPVDGAEIATDVAPTGFSVTTLRYRGVWLEGAIDAGRIAGAIRRAGENGGTVVGTLQPATASAPPEFRDAGVFQWWERPYPPR